MREETKNQDNLSDKISGKSVVGRLPDWGGSVAKLKGQVS